jgi:hypothetical protein
MISRLWDLPLLRLDVGALFGSLVGDPKSGFAGHFRLLKSSRPAFCGLMN